MRLRNYRQPCAIVIGLDSMNGLQTARILAQRGVPVIAIAKDPKHYCCRTKVCKEVFFANTSDEEFISLLELEGPRFDQKPILVPCTDMNVLMVSRHRQRLERWYHVILPSLDVVVMMMNKFHLYSYLQQEGFPIPRTFFLRSRADAIQVSREISYPCLLKPPVSATPEWEKNSKLKAYKIPGPQELIKLYEQCAAWADLLIAQEWIEGPNSNLYSCNCYFDCSSEPIVTFVSRKLRQWPPETGESCLGEECHNDIVLQETIRLFKSVNYRGLGYLEMKLDERSGKYYIIEPNVGRPTGRSAIAEAGGVEFLYTMYCEAAGRSLPENREQMYKGVKWVCLRRDFQSALYCWRRGDLTLKEWWRSLKGQKAYALLSWKDLGPFFGDLKRAFFLFMSREERRKREYKNPLS